MIDTPPRPSGARRPARRGADEPARALNSVEPSPERVRRGPRDRDAADPAPPAPSSPGERSTRPGDLPAAVRARYFGETSRLGLGVSFYEGPGAKRAAFHDRGARLETDQTHPTVARDLALIAQHRGWSAVRVRGEDEFRRQAWMEARVLGLEVSGYRPRERDTQELAKRLQSEVRRERRMDERAREPGSGRSQGPRSRAAEGRILETGVAPYRRREDGAATPYVRLDRGGERPLEVWGAGLTDALARSGAEVGDRVVIRRDGVQRAEPERTRAKAVATLSERDADTRLFGSYDAARFRRLSPAEAARDPDLSGAQSHLTVLDTVIDRLVTDPERRARLHAEARGIVADELSQGRRFPPARVREVEPVLARDVAEAFRRDREPERARAR